MYNNRMRGRIRVKRNNSGGRGGFSYPRGAGAARRPGAGKRLDHNLFINKATNGAVVQSANEIKNKFTDFEIDQSIKSNLEKRNYQIPTPIQDQAIAHILEGRDVIGIANTGTGKTGAFLIPLINKILQNKNERVLIVTPTRELAVQIDDELKLFAKGTGIYSVLAIGGANIRRQISDLRKNHNFVIGTPGRLIDLIKGNRLRLAECKNVVLDEVDRMVDIGFIKDVEFLVAQLPEKRHSLFFSATITPKVDQILKKFVNNPVTVSVKTGETAENVEQDIIRIRDRSKKVEILHDLLIQKEFEKVLVFGRTKHGIEKLQKTLDARGFKVSSIHGNKSQGKRQRALKEFKDSRIQILLATDVASRGIDVKDVTHVINYDAPESYDDYVHRIGRTGRANKKGMALTFVE